MQKTVIDFLFKRSEESFVVSPEFHFRKGSKEVGDRDVWTRHSVKRDFRRRTKNLFEKYLIEKNLFEKCLIEEM